MKIKTTILSIIVAASTLYSQDNNTSYIPAIARTPAPPGDVMHAPALPSAQRDLDTIERLRQHVKQLEQEIQSYQQQNQQLLEQSEQTNLALQDTLDWMNEYYRQLHVTMLTGWFYHETYGWLYTDQEDFPYLYRNDNQTWYYFARDHEHSSDGRAFYNYTTNEWEFWK